jgi:hypothetical protein
MAGSDSRYPPLKIATYYSHLNGLEFLMVHKPSLWKEIQDVIKRADATRCQPAHEVQVILAGNFHLGVRTQAENASRGIHENRLLR